MKPTDLVAIHAITRKPGAKVETIAPGQSFSPKNDDEREFFIRLKAARPPLETELDSKPAAKKSSGKKAPAKKDPEPEVKPVVLEGDDAPGTDDGMLD